MGTVPRMECYTIWCQYYRLFWRNPLNRRVTDRVLQLVACMYGVITVTTRKISSWHGWRFLDLSEKLVYRVTGFFDKNYVTNTFGSPSVDYFVQSCKLARYSFFHIAQKYRCRSIISHHFSSFALKIALLLNKILRVTSTTLV